MWSSVAVHDDCTSTLTHLISVGLVQLTVLALEVHPDFEVQISLVATVRYHREDAVDLFAFSAGHRLVNVEHGVLPMGVVLFWS